MNIRVKAALQTFGILVAGAVGGSICHLLGQYFTPQELINGVSIAAMIFLVYTMYQLVLSRLEYQEKVNKLVEKK